MTTKRLDNDIIDKYDYEKVVVSVNKKFTKYRWLKTKKSLVLNKYKSPLVEEKIGDIPKTNSDTTGNKALKLIQIDEYLEQFDNELSQLKEKLTVEEKIVLQNSIIDKTTDEILSIKLSISRAKVYPYKKSCYVKVAMFFNLDLEDDLIKY